MGNISLTGEEERLELLAVRFGFECVSTPVNVCNLQPQNTLTYCVNCARKTMFVISCNTCTMFCLCHNIIVGHTICTFSCCRTFNCCFTLVAGC